MGLVGDGIADYGTRGIVRSGVGALGDGPQVVEQRQGKLGRTLSGLDVRHQGGVGRLSGPAEGDAVEALDHDGDEAQLSHGDVALSAIEGDGGGSLLPLGGSGDQDHDLGVLRHRPSFSLRQKKSPDALALEGGRHGEPAQFGGEGGGGDVETSDGKFARSVSSVKPGQTMSELCFGPTFLYIEKDICRLPIWGRFSFDLKKSRRTRCLD
jgi:hypothetical protein